MTLTQIAEHIVPGKRLGRHIHDPAARAALRQTTGPPPLASHLISVIHASSPNMPLNQANVGSCTCEAEVGALNTVPHWKAGNPALNQTDAYRAYSLEQQLMGYGPYPPADNGGTGQHACEAGEKLGWVSAFQVAEGISEVLLALVLRPVMIGQNWYTSFDTPNAQGIISIAPGATVRGGHETVATQLIVPEPIAAADIPARLDDIQVWFWQSWGLGVYGLNGSGRFGMTARTLNSLLYQGGDATVPRTKLGWVAQP